MQRWMVSLLLVGCSHVSGGHGHRGSDTVEPTTACPIPQRNAPVGRDAPARTGEGRADGLLLTNARLVDGTGNAPRDGLSVLVRGDRIERIGAQIHPPDGVRVIDLGGRTLLPGFIDAHTHIGFDPAGNYAASVERDIRELEVDGVLRAVRNAWFTLRAGFTTVRNVGGGFGDRALRDAIVAGLIPGPRMLVANHSIGITGGHCDDTNALRPAVFGAERDHRDGVADGPEEVRKAVRYQIKHGADVIKICATGGVLSQGDGVGAPQLTVEEMRAIVDEASRAKRKVAAHAHGNLGIREAIEAGVHSIEHGSVLDKPTVALMKRKGTVLVPTTYVAKVVERRADEGMLSEDSAHKAREIGPRMRQSFKLAYASGVSIALGSDAGVFPHGENGREFTTMVDLGMAPMDALVAGTAGAARLLGLADVGIVAEGNRADLVVVDGDPLDTIQVVETPSMVIKGGVVYVEPGWVD